MPVGFCVKRRMERMRKMPITKKKYGEYNGCDVVEYILDNNCGIKASILNYGGIIKNLIVKDKDGVDRDVVLGHKDFEVYKSNPDYYGALIGRFANRLEDSVFELNGTTYHVPVNNGRASLHGGINGFDKKVWAVTEKEDASSCAIIMTIVSPDGEEGYPGTATVTVTYTLTKDTLAVNYKASSDKDTIFNMTNHAYFNLSGHDSGNFYNHTLQLNCSFYTPNTSECFPYGEVHSVKNTPFDFTVAKGVGQDIESDFEQIAMFKGYDHNFIIDGEGMRTAAVLKSNDSGIKMTVNTDKPAVQLYTCNSTNEELVCKDSAIYKRHQALCLETQLYPNSMKYRHFPSPVLKKGEVYDYTTEFVFSVEK